MIAYHIIPETGSIAVLDEAPGVPTGILAQFSFVQNADIEWDIFDTAEPGQMPVETVSYLAEVYRWVMDIDPETFYERS